MNVSAIVWIGVALVLTLVELGHPGLFYFLAAGCAALVTGICALYLPVPVVQLGAFLTSFLIIFCLFKAFLKPYLSKHSGMRTNMYALVGKHGYVIMPILPSKMGQIKVNGEVWSARSLEKENQEISIGKQVEIVQVSGCHCVVKLLEERA